MFDKISFTFHIL